jgi:hypothetical protein
LIFLQIGSPYIYLKDNTSLSHNHDLKDNTFDSIEMYLTKFFTYICTVGSYFFCHEVDFYDINKSVIQTKSRPDPVIAGIELHDNHLICNDRSVECTHLFVFIRRLCYKELIGLLCFGCTSTSNSFLYKPLNYF